MFFFLPRSLISLVLFLGGKKKKEKKEKKENVCNGNNLLAFCQVLKRRVVFSFRVIFSFFFNFFFSFNPERKCNYGQSYDSFIFVQ